MNAPDPPPLRYWAFISYSHADSRMAAAIHRRLETYRLPAAVREGRDVPERLYPVFRDRDELPGAANLGDLLTRALADSDALLVLCSPAAARSQWVNEEILQFKRLGRSERIFPVILAGEPYSADTPGRDPAEECFPLALRRIMGQDGALTVQPAEPLAIDLRPGKDGMRLGMLKLVAGIADVPLSQLEQRDTLRRQRNLQRLAAGIALIALLLLGMLVEAVSARREAEKERNAAEHRRIETLGMQLAAESTNQLATNPDGALLYALAGLQVSPQPATLAALWRRVLESASLEKVATTEHPADALAVSADESTFFIGGSDGHVRVVQLDGQRAWVPDWQAHQGRITALAALSPGVLASAGKDGSVTLHGRLGQRLATPIALDDDTVLTLAASASRHTLFAGTRKGSLMRWQAADPGAARLFIRAGQGPIWAMTLAFDGSWLASNGGDGRVALWTDTLSPLPCKLPMKAMPIAMAAHPSLPLLAILDANSVVSIVKVPGCTPVVAPLQTYRRAVAGIGAQLLAKIAFSPDGSELLFPVDGGKVVGWDWQRPGEISHPVSRIQHRANVIALTALKHRLASLDSDGKLIVRRLDGELLPEQIIDAHSDKARRVAYSPDGRYLASVGYDGAVSIYASSALSQPLARNADHVGRLLSLAWSANSAMLAVAGAGPEVDLWQASDRFQRKTILHTQHQDEISALAFDPAGKRLASASYDGKIEVSPLDRHTAPALIETGAAIQAMAYDPTGRWLASAGDDKQIHLWDPQSGRPVGPPLRRHAEIADAAVIALAVSANGAHLYSAGNDGTVVQWNTSDWKPTVLQTESADLRLLGIALSPDETMLAMARQDGRAVIYTLQGRITRLAALGETGADLGVAISPDGHSLATASADGSVHVWSLRQEDWRRIACEKANRAIGKAEWERLTGNTDLPAGCSQ